MKYDDKYLEDIVLEAEPYHDEWLEKAKIDDKFAHGDQWDEDVKNELEEQGRPALTLNLIRPIIRLLTGIERKSRYDMRAMPALRCEWIISILLSCIICAKWVLTRL